MESYITKCCHGSAILSPLPYTWFYEDLQDLLELTPQKDVLFIIGDWNAKVGSQETPGVTANLALEYGMKQGKDQ